MPGGFLWYTDSMGKHVYNKGNAPAIYGIESTIQPGHYATLPDELVARLKTTSLPLVYEDDPEFPPLWIRSIPEKTPDQIP